LFLSAVFLSAVFLSAVFLSAVFLDFGVIHRSCIDVASVKQFQVIAHRRVPSDPR
jgi:hypothetical protein